MSLALFRADVDLMVSKIIHFEIMVPVIYFVTIGVALLAVYVLSS